MKTDPKPPKHLTRATKQWWRKLVSEFVFDDHHLKLLRLACEAWDRGQEAREVLAKEGLTFLDRFDQPKKRPEISIESDARISFARLLRELNLDLDEPESPRPPTKPSSKRSNYAQTET